MSEKLKISKSEWEVMEVLWDKSPMTFDEIVEVLSPKMDWSNHHIKAFITRLMKKGTIYYEKVGQVYNYYPLISHEECIKVHNESFLKRIYNETFGSW